MAKAVVTFCEVGGRTYSGGSVDAIRLRTVKTKVLTVGSSSVTTTNDLNARYNYVSITAIGGNIWVKAGTGTPVADNTGCLLIENQTKDFSLDKGDVLAFIEAATI